MYFKAPPTPFPFMQLKESTHFLNSMISVNHVKEEEFQLMVKSLYLQILFL